MISVAKPLSSAQATLYSLHQLQFIALFCIPFTACTKCSLLHYAVFPLQPAPNAVYSIMLYSLYNLHQLQFIALLYSLYNLHQLQFIALLYSLYNLHQMRFIASCFIPFTACTNCSLLYYAIQLHSF